MKPMDAILGKEGTEIKCTQFIHWFESKAKVGDKCLCGKTTRPAKIKKKGKRENS